MSKSKDCFTRDHNNVSEWSDMSTLEPLYEWPSTIKIQLSMLVWYKTDIIIFISLNITSSWYNWSIAHLTLNTHSLIHSLTHSLTHNLTGDYYVRNIILKSDMFFSQCKHYLISSNILYSHVHFYLFNDINFHSMSIKMFLRKSAINKVIFKILSIIKIDNF